MTYAPGSIASHSGNNADTAMESVANALRFNQEIKKSPGVITGGFLLLAAYRLQIVRVRRDLFGGLGGLFGGLFGALVLRLAGGHLGKSRAAILPALP